jgi:hypothetical protein
MVWGINDFDEAAKMPYALDLVRLATSALLATPDGKHSPDDICRAILTGYGTGLAHPRPIVLENDNAWLRDWIESVTQKRGEFWKKLNGKLSDANGKSDRPRQRLSKALRKALPDTTEKTKFNRRQAGVGSLGRPRWVAIGEWEGGPVVREAKALVPSAWDRVAKKKKLKSHARDLAFSRYHPKDPTLIFRNGIVVRRLAPHNRKLDLDGEEKRGVPLKLLETMGREIANIHSDSAKRVPAIQADLAGRKSGWLLEASSRAARAIEKDHKAWIGKRA